MTALRHPTRRPHRVRAVLIGLGVMTLAVVVAAAVVWSRAGRWGVPYFSFTNEFGSQCTNGWAGHTCNPITLDQIADVAKVRFPVDTVIVNGEYRQTHDFFLNTRLEIPRNQAKKSLAAMNKAYGKCLPGHATTLPSDGLKQICVMSNADGAVTKGVPEDRIYTVGTGVRSDGVRVVQIDLRSR